LSENIQLLYNIYITLISLKYKKCKFNNNTFKYVYNSHIDRYMNIVFIYFIIYLYIIHVLDKYKNNLGYIRINIVTYYFITKDLRKKLNKDKHI